MTIKCIDKDGHFYEAIHDEILEKEFSVENCKYHRKVNKQKIYKKSICSFCGDIIGDDNKTDNSSCKEE